MENGGLMIKLPKTRLSGKVFGKLKVISYKGNGFYVCHCACGNKPEVHRRYLENGEAKYCYDCVLATGEHSGMERG